jgi:micrococcal nuclease
MTTYIYAYEATVLKVVDGDTIDVVIDLGFGIRIEHRARIRGINAPELRGPDAFAGKNARAMLEALINTHTLATRNVFLKSHKQDIDKWGRYVFDVYAGSLNLAEAMVNSGHAQRTER